METLRQIIRYFISNPGSNFKFYPHILIFVGVLFLVAIIFGAIIKSKKNENPVLKKHFEKTPSRLVYFGLTFLFLLLVRYEAIPLFSWRIWFLLIGVGFIVFLFFLIKKSVKTYPKELKKFQNRPKAKQVKKENKYSTKK